MSPWTNTLLATGIAIAVIVVAGMMVFGTPAGKGHPLPTPRPNNPAIAKVVQAQ